MTRQIFRLARVAVCVAAIGVMAAEAAQAAPARVASNTNLRQGPGVSFAIITTVPGGTVIDVIRCGGEWCNVMAGSQPGYMIARNLGMGGPVGVVRTGPPVVVVGPPYGYGPYYGRRFYGPGFYGPGFYGPRRYWRRW
jgi:uncharacterized protein YraI